MSERKIAFVATEDWFIGSHFRFLLERARADGYEPVVIARATGALDQDRVRVIDAKFSRGSLRPWDMVRDAAFLRQTLLAERPTLIHAIALKGVLLTLLAGVRDPRVHAITGRGYLAIATAPPARLARALLARYIRNDLDRDHVVLAVENADDRAWAEAGRALADEHVVSLPGAGIDPSDFHAAPEPDGPIVIGLAARLIRSKGVDVAVAALEMLRARGRDIVLAIAGAPDPENPDHVDDAEIARWRALPAVRIEGHVRDIDAFWARAHIACLPSRGGEGLPRSLLEAAACARPIVTTQTPGCRDFVSEGQTGFLVPPNNAAALADALDALVTDGVLRQKLGGAGRARVLGGYTTAHAAQAASRAWAAALAG